MNDIPFVAKLIAAIICRAIDYAKSGSREAEDNAQGDLADSIEKALMEVEKSK